ncbi:MAG: ABC transporter permease [Spirochaetes bacterium]|nr:MAG: ABC transporter permease [Spirochaetota bacterium]
MDFKEVTGENRFLKALQKNIVYVVFLTIFIFFSLVLRGKFLSYSNLMNIARQTSIYSIMAIGMTFALSAGEIDLSLDSVIALTAMVTAVVLRDFGIVLGVLAGLGTGLAVGSFNGIIVAKLKVPSFLVTLTTLEIVAALARWITNLKTIPISNDTYNFIFGSGDIGPIPILFLWLILFLVIGYIALKRIPFGLKLLATGGNERAAIFSGIKTRKIKMIALIISAVGASIGGILYAGRLHGARYTLGQGTVLSVIAASVIGGTSLFGGKGTVIGSVIGAVMIGMVNNGLILMGLSVAQQMFFRGLILLIAISINVHLQTRRI